MSSEPYQCVLHGSYRKDLELIRHIAELFTLAGVTVLCPVSFSTKDPGAEFIVFENDKGTPDNIERNLLETLRAHKHNPKFFSYFVNKDGYLGPSASYELSLVRELGISFYALQQPSTIPITLPTTSVIRPIEVVRKILLGCT